MYAAIATVLLFTVSDAVDEMYFADHGDDDGCSHNPDTTLRVMRGWPLQINCNDIFFSTILASNYYENESEKDYKCVVSTGGVIVHRTNITNTESYASSVADTDPYLIQEVSEDLNGTVYTAELIGDSNCSKSYVVVVEKPNEELSCSEADLKISQEFVNGKTRLLQCSADKNTIFLDAEDYLVTWYKDCQEIKTTTKTGRTVNLQNGVVDSYMFTDVNFRTTPGVYTCSVTYKGYERFLTKADVCVKYATSRGPPFIRYITQMETAEPVGKDVTLTCGGFANTAMSISFGVIWIKNSTSDLREIICEQYLHGNMGEQHSSQKYHCNLNSDVGEVSTCYNNFEEAMKDEYKGVVRINSSLTIRNFQEEDAGDYVCQVLTTGRSAHVLFRVNVRPTNHLIVILGSVIGVFALLLASLLLCIYLRRGNFRRNRQKSVENSTTDTKSDGLPGKNEEKPTVLPIANVRNDMLI